MSKRILFIGTLVLGVAAVVDTAAAQSMACGHRAEIVASLGGKFGETRHGGGLAGPSAIFELFASEKTGTWTILRTGANGMSCVMAVGNGWQSDDAPVSAIGDPA
jgi:hypothetical protein